MQVCISWKRLKVWDHEVVGVWLTGWLLGLVQNQSVMVVADCVKCSVLLGTCNDLPWG